MAYKGTSKYNGVFTSGQTIGRWTIVSGDIVLKREAMVECACECGNQRLVSAYTLTKGTSTGCKVCQNKSYAGKNNPNWKGGAVIPGEIFYRVKMGAEKRNIEFTVTLDDLECLFTKQNRKCALSNQPICFSTDENTASLDRIDSTVGYHKDNIQWVHKDINVMKNGYNIEYFIKMCRMVYENTKNVKISESTTSTFTFGK